MNTQTQISTFAECVFDASDTVEIRQLPAGKSTWHAGSALQGQVAMLTAANEAGQNIYCGANPRKQSGGSKAGDVLLARCFFVDFDGIDTDAASKRIESAGLPKPTLLLDSGHGAHAYWRLTEPISDLAKWTRGQKRLIAALDSDRTIHDRPRIMRLPGFWNVKHEPRVACKIVEADPARQYLIDTVLAELPDADRPVTISKTGELDFAKPVSDSCGNDGGIPQGSRDSTLTSLAGSMRRRGMTVTEIAAALKVANTERCKPPLPDSDVERIAKSIGSRPASSSVGGIARDFEPFPVEMLPEPIRKYVAEAAKAIGCDESFVAVPMLATLAGSVGNTRRIRLKDDWTEPSALWAAIVGDSGTQKTPALSKATAFIEREQNTAVAKHMADLRDFKRAQKCYEAKLKQWQRKGEGNPPDEPITPVLQRYIVSDTTIEALASVLQHASRGVTLVRDELAGWLNSFDQYKGGKGGDVAHWLTLYGAKPLTMDRKSGLQNLIHVPIASVSIAGGIQPATLRRALGQEHFENGLASRLLLTYPPKRLRQWTNATVSAQTSADVAKVFSCLLRLDFAVEGEQKVPIDLPLTPVAQTLYQSFYDRVGLERLTMNEAESALWSKLEGTAARLALVIHLTRCAAGDAALVSSSQVDEQSISAGVALAEWFGAECTRIYAQLTKPATGDLLSPELRELLVYLGGKDEWFTVREVSQGPRAYRGKSQLAEEHLDQMTAAGLLERQDVPPGPAGGRPTTRYRLLPTGYGHETSENHGDTQGSVAVAAKPVEQQVQDVPAIAI